MASHMEWMQQISTRTLESKGLTLDDYMYSMSQYNQPLDEIAILAFARMYHVHIAILQNGCYWSTNHNKKLEECNIFLLYYGKLEFEDTRSANSNPDLEAVTPGLDVPTPASACYDLRPKKKADNPGLKEPQKPEPHKYDLRSKTPKIEPKSKGQKTKNSLKAGLLDPDSVKSARKDTDSAIESSDDEPKHKV